MPVLEPLQFVLLDTVTSGVVFLPSLLFSRSHSLSFNRLSLPPPQPACCVLQCSLAHRRCQAQALKWSLPPRGRDRSRCSPP
eukprot:534487-Rhodomonas_salina.1